MNNKENTYLSLDIKTAKKNGLPCQVGISLIEDGHVVSTTTYLIQPPENEYSEGFYTTHMVRPRMTEVSQNWPEFWEENRWQFDDISIVVPAIEVFHHLRRALSYYKLPFPRWGEIIDVSSLYHRTFNYLAERMDFTKESLLDAGRKSLCAAILFIKYEKKDKSALSLVKRERTAESNREKHIPECVRNNPYFNKRVIVTGIFEHTNYLNSVYFLGSEYSNYVLKSLGAKNRVTLSSITDYIFIGEDPDYSLLNWLDDNKYDNMNKNIKQLGDKEMQEAIRLHDEVLESIISLDASIRSCPLYGLKFACIPPYEQIFESNSVYKDFLLLCGVQKSNSIEDADIFPIGLSTKVEDAKEILTLHENGKRIVVIDDLFDLVPILYYLVENYTSGKPVFTKEALARVTRKVNKWVEGAEKHLNFVIDVEEIANSVDEEECTSVEDATVEKEKTEEEWLAPSLCDQFPIDGNHTEESVNLEAAIAAIQKRKDLEQQEIKQNKQTEMEQRGVTSGPVSQKEAVSSPTMPPKKGIWSTVLWILLFIAAIIAVAFFGFALLAIAVFFIPLLKGKFK